MAEALNLTGYTMEETSVSPWWSPIQTFGAGLADRLTETASVFANAKLDAELMRWINKTDQLKAQEASTNQDKNAANAPVKGRDADGAPLTEDRIALFGNTSISKSHLKTAGFVLGGLLVAGLAYKAVK